MTRRVPIDQVCVHFTGLQDSICAAGVNYEMVKDRHARPLAVPCLVIEGEGACATRCARARYRLAGEPTPFDTSWTARMEAMARGECPFCGSTIHERRHVGRAVYADPCGHLLYEGPRGKR